MLSSVVKNQAEHFQWCHVIILKIVVDLTK